MTALQRSWSASCVDTTGSRITRLRTTTTLSSVPTSAHTDTSTQVLKQVSNPNSKLQSRRRRQRIWKWHSRKNSTNQRLNNRKCRNRPLLSKKYRCTKFRIKVRSIRNLTSRPVHMMGVGLLSTKTKQTCRLSWIKEASVRQTKACHPCRTRRTTLTAGKLEKTQDLTNAWACTSSYQMLDCRSSENHPQMFLQSTVQTRRKTESTLTRTLCNLTDTAMLATIHPNKGC